MEAVKSDEQGGDAQGRWIAGCALAVCEGWTVESDMFAGIAERFDAVRIRSGMLVVWEGIAGEDGEFGVVEFEEGFCCCSEFPAVGGEAFGLAGGFDGVVADVVFGAA